MTLRPTESRAVCHPDRHGSGLVMPATFRHKRLDNASRFPMNGRRPTSLIDVDRVDSAGYS